jgi:hypothetical protein
MYGRARLNTTIISPTSVIVRIRLQGYRPQLRSTGINALMDLYVQMGAKYFGRAHSCNLDNFNSTQPGTPSGRVQRDIVGTWAPIARQRSAVRHRLPQHACAAWVSSCRLVTATRHTAMRCKRQDGTGKWWWGESADLFRPQHTTGCLNNSCNNSAWRQFMHESMTPSTSII